MGAVGWGWWRSRTVSAEDPQWACPAGLKILIPGCVQWSWRQRERAAVLFGSFCVAITVGVFAWGTSTGFVVLAFAFLTHVISAMDVVRQATFPGFGRWMPWISTSGGLALGVYGPALGLATLVAWPEMHGGEEPGGYLVNCSAYRAGKPAPGDWVRLRSSPWGDRRVGVVIACAGQEVDWSSNQLRIDGERFWLGPPCQSDRPPEELSYVVPEGHVLVSANGGSRPGLAAERLVLVPTAQVVGRAWARLYPLRDRQLLP